MGDDPSKFLSHRLHGLHDVLQLGGALRVGGQGGLVFGRFPGEAVEDELVVADLAGVAVLVLVLAAAPAEHAVLVVLVPASAREGEDGLSAQVVPRGVSARLVALLELEAGVLATPVGLDGLDADVHGVA